MTNRSLTKTFNRAVKSATTTRRARNSDKNDGYQQSLSGTLGRRCFEAFLATQPSASNALPLFCRCAPPLYCAPPIEHGSSARGDASMCVPPLVFTARPHLATRSKGQKGRWRDCGTQRAENKDSCWPPFDPVFVFRQATSSRRSTTLALFLSHPFSRPSRNQMIFFHSLNFDKF